MNNFFIAGVIKSIQSESLKTGSTVYTVELSHTKSYRSTTGEWTKKELPIIIKAYGNTGLSLQQASEGESICCYGEITGKEYIKDGKRFVFIELTASHIYYVV